MSRISTAAYHLKFLTLIVRFVIFDYSIVWVYALCLTSIISSGFGLAICRLTQACLPSFERRSSVTMHINWNFEACRGNCKGCSIHFNGSRGSLPLITIYKAYCLHLRSCGTTYLMLITINYASRNIARLINVLWRLLFFFLGVICLFTPDGAVNLFEDWLLREVGVG